MKKIITLSLLLCFFSNGFGQSELSRTQLEERISTREKTIPALKPIQQVDSLSAQITDLNELIEIIQSDHLKRIGHYEILLSNDTTVFTDYEYDDQFIKSVPFCLKAHWDVVLNVTNLKRKMDNVDNTIASILSQPLKISPELRKQVIQESISSEVDEIYNLYLKINAMDISTLSDIQKAFIDNLKDHYNNYSIYFEQ